ncbi:hypothetical protein HAX54_028784, partial [Datura stramonium]|nr:hypothetical protein [Datura stramonium]
MSRRRKKKPPMKTSPEVQDDEALPDSVVIEDPSGNLITQEIEYEWKPLYCNSCCNIGHEDGSCKTKDKIPTVNKRRRKSVRQERRTKAGEAKVDNATRDQSNVPPIQECEEDDTTVTTEVAELLIERNDNAANNKSTFHPALVVSNIRNHISITLEMENVQYSTW